MKSKKAKKKSLYQKDDATTVNKLWVLCCVCNKKIHEGIRQRRLYTGEKGKTIFIDLYMCEKCLTKGEPWPGTKPYTGMSDHQIQNELDRFADNAKIRQD